jgi:hypothetical protein
MSTLRLREGWEVDLELGFTVFKRTRAPSVFAYVIIDPEGYIRAYRFGEFGLHAGSWCKTIEEAHAYLIASGSGSPWEVTP